MPLMIFTWLRIKQGHVPSLRKLGCLCRSQRVWGAMSVIRLHSEKINSLWHRSIWLSMNWKSLRVWEYFGAKISRSGAFRKLWMFMVSVKACVTRNVWHPHWFHFEAIKTYIFPELITDCLIKHSCFFLAPLCIRQTRKMTWRVLVISINSFQSDRAQLLTHWRPQVFNQHKSKEYLIWNRHILGLKLRISSVQYHCVLKVTHKGPRKQWRRKWNIESNVM